jgi:hypothetical protein
MLNPWLFQLGVEVQSVIALRVPRMAGGGARAGVAQVTRWPMRAVIHRQSKTGSDIGEFSIHSGTPSRYPELAPTRFQDFWRD